MDILKSRAVIILIIMILSVAFIGGADNTTLQDNNDNSISTNA